MEFSVRAQDAEDQDQDCPKYLSSEYPVNLIFKIDGAVSPKSLGFGQENRKFGLIFNSLTITPDD